MTDTPTAPDAAKDIVMDVLIDTDERFDDVPRAVIYELAAAGWLHDPAERDAGRAVLNATPKG